MKTIFYRTKKVLALFMCALLCMGTLSITSIAASTEITADSTAEDVYAAFGLTTDEDKAKLEVDIPAKMLSLKDDITLAPPDTINFKSGDWTLLGEGHTLTFTNHCFIVEGDAVLKLGQDGKGIALTSNANTLPVFSLNGTSKLYMYENVTIGPSYSPSTPAGIDIGTDAAFYMYGGKITECVNSASVAGGVYINGNGQFHMYGGIIENCSGMEGGAVGISDGANSIGGITNSNGLFYMHDGIIRNCTDTSQYGGGGAVSIYAQYADNYGEFIMDGGTIENCSTTTAYGAGAVAFAAIYRNIRGKFTMNGGTIQNCSTTGLGGGAVSFLSFGSVEAGEFIMNNGSIIKCFSDGTQGGGGGAIFSYAPMAKINIKGGKITQNSTNESGGGIYVYQGTAVIATEAAVYDNHSVTNGDDIAVGRSGAKVTIANLPSGLILSGSGREIDGWYSDAANTRWDLGAAYPPIPVSVPEGGTKTFTSQKSLKAAHDVRYGLNVSPAILDFESEETGYIAPAARTVTVTNTGDKSVTLTQPVSEYFEIGALSKTELSPGEKATFTVSPKASLPVGDYVEEIEVSGMSNYNRVASSVSASFEVKAKLRNLTVELNGGNGATTGGSYTAGTVVSIDAGSRDDYTFNGWTTSNGGVFENKDAASTMFTMPDADTTVTAVWAEDRNNNGIADDEEDRYTVTYTDGIADDEVFPDQAYSDLLSGTATPAFVGTPARKDYVFTGWTPTVADTVNGNATYTAVWAEDKNNNGVADDEEDRYTVTFHSNGHGTAPAQQRVLEGDAALEPTAPTASGWTFGGWYKDADCREAYDFSDRVSGDLELYAKWTEQSGDTTTPSTPSDAPQTGDNSNMMLWIALLSVSGAGVFGTTLYSRKRKSVK